MVDRRNKKRYRIKASLIIRVVDNFKNKIINRELYLKKGEKNE